MEFKDLVKTLKKNKSVPIAASFAGLALGMLLYFLPSKYISSGSFYVSKKTDKSYGFFTYEGYYAQQSALAYTDSVVTLTKSTDIKKSVLEKTNQSINEKNLRKLNKSVKIKKAGPQIIALEVIGKKYETAENTWIKFAESLIEKSNEMNKNGDENLMVKPISDKPLTRKIYKSPWVFGTAGFLAGMAVGILLVCGKEYFKN
jgi:capsular polysaccharide biosynthesis protein